MSLLTHSSFFIDVIATKHLYSTTKERVKSGVLSMSDPVQC